jgi:phospholipid/cholesterol/gamma-HCH transport system permease protein
MILRDLIFIFLKTLKTCFSGPYRLREISDHLYTMAVGSLPIILIATIFAGIVVTGEMAHHMNLALNSLQMIPGVSGQFIFRELGIIIPSLLLVAKVGASTTAEVATMKITDQIDALKLLKIDPIQYLVYPRFVANIISTCCLTLISVFVTLSFAILYATTSYGFTASEYLNNLAPFISLTDLGCALVKGIVFGGVMPIISCCYGFRCEGGAEGVGLATTNGVVLSTVVIIVLDFCITYLFSLII